MSERKYTSFKDFYPYYLSEHRATGTRITHFIGTSLFFVFLAAAIVLSKWWIGLIGVVSAYTMAWIGHFFIEKNKPATFQYPLWSLMGDFKLYFEILMFKESLSGDDQDNVSS